MMKVRDVRYVLRQRYEFSRALVIGINSYQNASPLEYAVNDAEAFRDVLVEELDFESENIKCVVDGEATRSKILQAFLSFTSGNVKVDDRLVVYFAGHGHTNTGFRGEVGYLVPHDADMNDSSTLLNTGV